MSSEKAPPPELKPEFPLSFLTGLFFMAAVMVALPVMQLIEGIVSDSQNQIEVVNITPPPVVDTPPPPPPPEDDTEIDEIEETREPPSLSELEVALNPDFSNFSGGDFTLPTVDLGGQMEELIYEIADLTQAPRLINWRAPQYPPEMQRARIAGEVSAIWVVEQDGSTSRISIEESTNPAFEEPVIRAVRSARFSPGEKDGTPVRTWVRQKIPFRPR